ncbi:DUF4625 domain-containing protein [Olivibacter sp. SDN3]|uniref:DUF4625 domain-containing protein n=1 Tax=Olivibacter sp. SDN3 TaxID=2764720 RepID=UPI001651AB7B|nr:DUF4625 domain-containing protein [Olivibacter sp. SDN3]QNL48158.1 DUF4625 domain-containing protein [Olivibacter sp. SDN3]
MYLQKKFVLLLFTTMQLFFSCSKEDDMPIDQAIPVIESLEIGSGDNGIGIIGRDFHFDMELTAGSLVENIQVNIQQRDDEAYAEEWSFTVNWNEYKGEGEVHVHKHFDIPDNAPEGLYDFVITINDENGSNLKEVRTIELLLAESLPVNPELYMFMVNKVDSGYFHIMHRGDFVNPEDTVFRKYEKISAMVEISNVKGDGQLYLLLIKKSANHLPETVDEIDFSKVLVTDTYAHENLSEAVSFSNFLQATDDQSSRPLPALTMGATEDNHLPNPSQITGDNNWENGEYCFGVVYTNSSHDISLHHYIEFEVTDF